MYQPPAGWFSPVTPGFNLVDEPWIPVEDRDGAYVVTGLRGLADGSRRYTMLASGDPLCDVAIMRLVIGMVRHATGGPATRDAWWELLDAPTLGAVLGDYLDEHREAFWLHHPTLGYAQAPADVFGDEPRTDSVARLSLVRASGTRKQLFDHSSDDEPLVCGPGEAARLLTTIQAYAPTGGMGYGSSRIAGGELLVTAVGVTVHDTVVLNTPCQDHSEGDDPSWVRAARGEHPVGQRPVAGVCDLFTRRPRRVHLLRNVDGDTGWCLFAGSERIPGGDEVRDPMLTYMDNGRPVRAPEVGTPLYTLVPPRAPSVHGTSSWLAEAGALDRVVAWRATALVTQKILVSRVVDEHVRLPARVLTDPDRVAAYTQVLDCAHAVHGRLMRMMRETRRQGDVENRTLPPARSDQARAAAGVSQRAAGLHYWARVTPIIAWATHAIDTGLSPDEAVAANARWRVALDAAARGAAEAGLEATSLGGIALSDHTQAFKAFVHGLATTIGTPFATTTRTQEAAT